MLIEFVKSVIFEGESSIIEKTSGFSKKRRYEWADQPRKIYKTFTLHGICDDSVIDTEIERLIRAHFIPSSEPGFSGWQRVVTPEELPEGIGIDTTNPSFNMVIVKPVKEWKMSKIIHELSGEQFFQLCKENGLGTDTLSDL